MAHSGKRSLRKFGGVDMLLTHSKQRCGHLPGLIISEEGCLAAVNLGDDADTTGAIYGQLAGAYYGVGAIPDEWKNTIVKRELIEQFSNDLFHLTANL